MINDAICSLPVLTEKSTFSANSCKGLLYSYIYFYRLSQRVKKFLYMSHGHVILHGVSHEKYQTEGTINNSEKLCTLWRFSWGYHPKTFIHSPITRFIFVADDVATFFPPLDLTTWLVKAMNTRKSSESLGRSK